jgi:hypothetical protein
MLVVVHDGHRPSSHVYFKRSSHDLHVIFSGMADAGKNTLINSILSTQLKGFPQKLKYNNNTTIAVCP